MFSPEIKPLERITGRICDQKSLIQHAKFIKRLVKDGCYNLATVQVWLLYQTLHYDKWAKPGLPKDFQSKFGHTIATYARIRGYKKILEAAAHEILDNITTKAYTSAANRCSFFFSHSFDEKGLD